MEFHGLDPSCVHKAIEKELTDHDWTINSTSETQIVAQQPPQAWMTLTVLPSGSDVKVLIDSGAIIHPKPGNERVEPIQATPQMTAVFNNSVRRIELACAASSG